MNTKKFLVTFEEVADEAGLTGETRTRFLAYMNRRWAGEEKQQSTTGYAMTWAQRFGKGREYDDSDSIGLLVLREIDGPITKDDFAAYERVHRKGGYNMLMQWRQAAQAAGLSPEKYKAILMQYDELLNKWPDCRLE